MTLEELKLEVKSLESRLYGLLMDALVVPGVDMDFLIKVRSHIKVSHRALEAAAKALNELEQGKE